MLISYIAIDRNNELACGLLDIDIARFTSIEVGFIFNNIKKHCNENGMDRDNLLIYFKEIEGDINDIS